MVCEEEGLKEVLRDLKKILEIFGSWRKGMEDSWRREECVVLCVTLMERWLKDLMFWLYLYFIREDGG